MKQIILRQASLLAFLCLFSSSILKAQDEIIGRWDLKVSNGERSMPSWLEVKQSGNKALVGYYVSYAGSARPIAEVMWKDGLFSFSIPPQWIGTHYMHLTGTVNADRMEGNIVDHMGNALSFTGERAPILLREAPAAWSEPRSLLDKNSLSGWIPVSENAANQWFVKDGVLTSPASGVNLRTEETFEDFKLHIEFRYPEHSNSGVYLRGRYEVQVEDSFGKQPSSVYLGGVYGFLTPNENVAKKAGEWQSYDITLVGRRVTVVANGKTIIGNQIIPGITGGALDSNEAAPGPIYLQGDHGPVEYRNITISVPE
ncbi:3-keto-disaccharide hydrolase [Robiginitalea sp. IMCC43444]|uniref:3-keto-disaccharide hydrolase n=1 Tax=Robiginitalea sp. IMCC43444 TaxID=3459121 RepID=UPI0040430DBD